ncbi:tRNA guanosine(34) transglycosylase Tgt [Candidatus Woesearchaeota archaeon]|nr:tRNA guanosine(34) transglycosylase Tgt [Candidatus Woesearchaeota archaeon]
MHFTITHQSNGARAGILQTAHGIIETPAFVPVGTRASVKSLSNQQLHELGVQVFFVNTYHIMQRPGVAVIKRFKGLHGFMHWDHPLMTDSGGYQAFSLGLGMEHGVGKMSNMFPGEHTGPAPRKMPPLAKIDDSGITFKSHLDGKRITLTPKHSIRIQEALGADIIMAFDECTSPLSDYHYVQQAVARTHRWAEICKKAHRKKSQALFGIIQGSDFRDLRQESADIISSLDFPGNAIGGSMGRKKEDMHRILEWVVPRLDAEKPRHLLGIGYVDDVFAAVQRGIDTFDCVAPTRHARSGLLFISPKAGGRRENKWRIQIDNTKYKTDTLPIDPYCGCTVCRSYSRAYLNHLFNMKELAFYQLATYHNVHFFMRLMEQMRESIHADAFAKLRRSWLR